MREITLTQGYVALVDDEDYERIAAFNWCIKRAPNTVYAMRKYGSRTFGYYKSSGFAVYMHHEILGRPPTKMKTDHIDRNGLNNQKDNLRFVSHSTNMRNSARIDNAKYVEKHGNGYRARITINGLTNRLSLYATPEEAYFAAMEFLKNGN